MFTDSDSQCDAQDPDAPYSYNHHYRYDGKARLKAYAGREYRYNASVTGCANSSRDGKPHAPSRITAARHWEAETYTYNCVGAVSERTVGDDTWTFGYNARGQVTRSRKNNDTPSENIYTASGQRILRKDPNGTETVYLGEQDVRKTAAGDVQVARYYAHGTRRSFGGVLTHSVSNHQGSVVATMRASNGNTSQQRYHPYGNLRQGSTVNDRGVPR